MLKQSLLVLSALTMAGCTVDEPRPRHAHVQPVEPAVVYVNEGPPPEPVEVIPAPRPGFIWIRGRYVYEGRHYAWAPGRWEAVRRPGVVYESGHWERGPRGYFWVEGHYR